MLGACRIQQQQATSYLPMGGRPHHHTHALPHAAHALLGGGGGGRGQEGCFAWRERLGVPQGGNQKKEGEEGKNLHVFLCWQKRL